MDHRTSEPAIELWESHILKKKKRLDPRPPMAWFHTIHAFHRLVAITIPYIRGPDLSRGLRWMDGWNNYRHENDKIVTEVLEVNDNFYKNTKSYHF